MMTKPLMKPIDMELHIRSLEKQTQGSREDIAYLVSQVEKVQEDLRALLMTLSRRGIL